ncbi:MAG TPA: HAD family hydrolase [Aggregatilineales bacterium]|nr:HAD family hydrolase [Aggregatilineales bacterium]
MNWFIDFDDTLVLGPNTWAIQTVLPELIEKNKLPSDRERLRSLILHSQREGANGAKDVDLLDNLFREMGWPDTLKTNLIERVFGQYTPVLFEDVLPFLKRMKADGQSLNILSNNNRAMQIAEMLGLSSYFDHIFTPKKFGLDRGKPHTEIWTYVAQACDVQGATLVGDDPWSDSAFADACGIRCFIVDRLNRLDTVIGSFRLVHTLDEIQVPALGTDYKAR